MTIKLYLDADITAAPLLASTLRHRGFDVVSAVEAGNDALSDQQQFEYAIRHQRVLLTFNIKDFVPLAENFYAEHREFPGLIVSPQIKGPQFSLLLRLILNLLNRVDAETIFDHQYELLSSCIKIIPDMHQHTKLSAADLWATFD